MSKIMKNKATFWCSVVLFIFIVSVITPVYALGANYTNATTTVTTTTAQNSTKVVIKPQTSMFATPQIQSNLPGNFSMMDYNGNPIGSSVVIPNSTDANLYYPINVGSNIEYSNSYTEEEQQASYINIANNSNSFGSYSVSLVSDKHSLSAGQTVDFFFNTSLCEVDLAVGKAGIYQIWYNNINFNSIYIQSPTQTGIDYEYGQLPAVSHTNSISIGKYFYFLAAEKGTYQIYLTSSSPYVKLRCEYHAPTPISFGQQILGGVDISSPNFTNPQYSMDVYSFSASVSDYYTYFLQYDYGNPSAHFFYSTAGYSSYDSMGASTNGIYDPESTGMVYVVIDNPAYYSWNNYNVKVPSPIKYTLKLNQIVPTTYQPNNGSDLIMVGPIPGGVAKTMDISQTSVMSMQFKSVGQNSPSIYDTGYGSYWEQIVDGYPEPVQTFDNVFSTTTPKTEKDLNYLLAPGTYKILFYYQGSGQNEYMQINSVLTPVSNTSVILQNVTTPLNLTTDYTDFTLQNWGNQSISPGYSMGNALTFGADTNLRNYGFNITLDPSKNPSVFNQILNPDLGFLYAAVNGSFYNYTNEIIPGNGLAVPFKSNGATAGDMFYIGSYDKFSSISIDLSKAASQNSFYWQYCDYYYNGYAGWVNFSPSTDNFTDGTNYNNTGTLTKSGTISWNSSVMSNWVYVNSNTNYTGTTGVPDTNGRNFYLIRAVCNNSVSNIPTVTTVSLKKFVTVEIDLNTQLGFDTQAIKSHYFDPVYGNSYPMSVSNTGSLVSVSASDFSMNTNFFYKTGFVFFSGSNWYNLDYNGSTVGTQERLNQSLTFSVSLYRLDDYKQFEYNMNQNIPTVSSDQLNLTSYNGYDAHYSYNASTYQYVYIKIDPRTQYDWTQLNVNVENGTLIGSPTLLSPFNGTYIYLEGDSYNSMGNSWIMNSSATSENMTTEFGFVTNYMLLKLEIASINPGALTTVNIFSGQYGYPFLTFSPVQSPQTQWQWWYTLLIVIGAVAIGLAVTFVVYKKKNPTFSLKRDLLHRV